MENSSISESSESSASQTGGAFSRMRRIVKIGGWITFAVLSFLIFTLIKLPEDRTKNYLQGSITAALNARGITFTADESKLSMGLLGISYQLKGITLNPPAPSPAVKIERIDFSPSLFSLIFGRMGGKIKLTQGEGVFQSSFAIKNNDLSLSFKAKELDLGKIGVLPLLANIQGSAVVNGEASVSGNLNSPATWSGEIKLDINKVNIEAQSIQGFAIPRLSISSGIVQLNVEHGKGAIKSIQLGKTGNASDDIIATLTGDILLGKQWESSTMNVKAHFSLSQKILKAFVLIDALLGAGKQPDGSYVYTLSGPLLSPTPTPVKGT